MNNIVTAFGSHFLCDFPSMLRYCDYSLKSHLPGCISNIHSVPPHVLTDVLNAVKWRSSFKINGLKI